MTVSHVLLTSCRRFFTHMLFTLGCLCWLLLIQLVNTCKTPGLPCLFQVHWSSLNQFASWSKVPRAAFRWTIRCWFLDVSSHHSSDELSTRTSWTNLPTCANCCFWVPPLLIKYLSSAVQWKSQDVCWIRGVTSLEVCKSSWHCSLDWLLVSPAMRTSLTEDKHQLLFYSPLRTGSRMRKMFPAENIGRSRKKSFIHYIFMTFIREPILTPKVLDVWLF